MEQKKLYRVEEDKKLAGVCGGFAEYFNLDVTLVRLIWAIGTLVTAVGIGVVAYIICAAIMPTKSSL